MKKAQGLALGFFHACSSIGICRGRYRRTIDATRNGDYSPQLNMSVPQIAILQAIWNILIMKDDVFTKVACKLLAYAQ